MMKRKFFASSLILTVLVTAVDAVSCTCLPGDCHAYSGAENRGSMPRCHLNDSGQARTTSRENACCGKCRLEKTEAVFREPLFLARTPSERSAVQAEPVQKESLTQKKNFSREGDSSPPFSFLTQRVLNITFSFRAPPAGRFF